MTISYQFNVHTASFAGFAKLLWRWKGSVYKFVIKETLVFGLLYFVTSLIYRIVLDEPQRRIFENVSRHIGDNKNLIPLTFVLGFYVQFVVGRWWDQYLHYPWPDRLLHLVIMYIPGFDERSRTIRRTLARWTCLSIILLTRGVSVVAKKRFPTLDSLVDAGLMTKEEKEMYDNVTIPYAKFWVPMLWFTELIKEAKKDKLFHDPSGASTKHFLEEIALLRTNAWKIWSFDWVSVPIVYTQVITLATYTYFLGAIFSRQFLDPEQNYEHFYVDFYFPAFAFLQFFFYVGWLKVAESLINPWGEDDDDFEVNWFIDRHVQVAFLTVDEKFGQMPTITKDMYWNTRDVKVPYNSRQAMNRRLSVDNLGSTIHLNTYEKDNGYLPTFGEGDPVHLPPSLLDAVVGKRTVSTGEDRSPFKLPHYDLQDGPLREFFADERHLNEIPRRKITPMKMTTSFLVTPIEERPEWSENNSMRSETTSPTPDPVRLRCGTSSDDETGNERP